MVRSKHVDKSKVRVAYLEVAALVHRDTKLALLSLCTCIIERILCSIFRFRFRFSLSFLLFSVQDIIFNVAKRLFALVEVFS